MGDKLEQEIMLVAEQIEMEILILLVLFWIRVETVLYIFKKRGGLIFLRVNFFWEVQIFSCILLVGEGFCYFSVANYKTKLKDIMVWMSWGLIYKFKKKIMENNIIAGRMKNLLRNLILMLKT